MRPPVPSLDVGAAGESGPGSRSSSSATSPIVVDNEESDFASNDTDSSVGLPNVQDMQVADGSYECDAPIHSLPNEILISIFTKLEKPHEVLQCMLACKRWAKNAVDLLWHRPSCTTWPKLEIISQALTAPHPYFAYNSFIKRLNLAALADKLNDGSVEALSSCNRVERLTLTNCTQLTDSGVIPLVQNSSSLLALDVSADKNITDATIHAIADNCKRLQGLNVSNCVNVTDASMIKLARACRYIKRLKLNECSQMSDAPILEFAQHCPNILEIDLHGCNQITDAPVTALLTKGQSLRELRLASCDKITDVGFLSLPAGRSYDHLRILDLTSCSNLTDASVQRIIDVAPRLRNLVLAKCKEITDTAVYAISKLGKNLHYVHLGHCGNITDEAVKKLVASCNRIRYIDLGCCSHLTDLSVTKLATLPKLKRIGLVKCNNITDESVLTLARSASRARYRRDADGHPVLGQGEYYQSSLERVHLSYCTNLTVKSIIRLLNSCPRLTHLSLTGVHGFLREEFQQFGRDPPKEFTDHQRAVFCVFSGTGVNKLRNYLNEAPEYATLRDGQRPRQQYPGGPIPPPPPPLPGMAGQLGGDFLPAGDGEMDEADDEDNYEGLDGSELVGAAVADGNAPNGQQPMVGMTGPGATQFGGGLLGGLVPPPPPPVPAPPGGIVPLHGGPIVVDPASETGTPDPEQDDGH